MHPYLLQALADEHRDRLLTAAKTRRARRTAVRDASWPENRPALGLLCKLAPQASVRWSLGEYEASIPLAPR